MADTLYSCMGCGRVITAAQAESVGKCMTCSGELARPEPAVTEEEPLGTIGLRNLGRSSTPEPPPSQSVVMRRMGQPRSEPEAPPTGTRSGVLRRPGTSASQEVEAPPIGGSSGTGLRRPGASAAPPPRQSAREAAPARDVGAATSSGTGLRLRRDKGKEEQEGEWYANLGKGMMGLGSEKIRGPFSWTELTCLVVNDTLNQSHRVRKGDDGPWRLAGEVPHLFGEEVMRQKDNKKYRDSMAKQREKNQETRKKKYAMADVDKGMMSGLLMMVGAAVWFFVALAFGVIFFYPPILFLIGLGTFLKGLFNGKL